MSARANAARQWVGVIALALASMFSAGLATNAYAQIAFRGAAMAAVQVTGSSPNFSGAGAIASAVSGNLTPALPAGWQPGDFFICVIESRDNMASTMPAGWNLLSQGSGASGLHRATLFWKRAAAGDTAPTIAHASGAGAGRIIAQIYAFAYVDMTTPFDVLGSFTASPADLTTEAEAITTVTADTLLFFTAQIGAISASAGSLTGSSPWNLADSGSAGVAGDGVSIAAYFGNRWGAAGTQAAVVLAHSDSAESHGSQIALRQSTTLTIAKPAGTVANDVMIASISATANMPTVTAPAGWTLVRRLDNGQSNALLVYVKTAGAAEPAQYTWTLSFSQGVAGGIQSFSGVDPVSPILVENGQSIGASPNATPSITTTVANAMLVSSHAELGLASWTPPAGMTEAFDISLLNIAAEGNYALQPAAGPSGVKTATASGFPNGGNAHILALRPASAAGGAGGAQIFYISTDHLNTPRLITNQAQQAVWRWDQAEPFGTFPPNENPSGLGAFVFNLRFPGQYADKETNTHYNMARDYDPSIGRYVQSDPIGLFGGINTYVYVHDPLTQSDPQGLMGRGSGANAPHDPPPPRATPIPPSCNGEWQQVRDFTRNFLSQFTLNCTCYWSCYACGGSAFPDPNPGQYQTPGKIIFSSKPGKDFNPKKGDDCLCDKPGPQTKCKTCS